VLPFKFAQKSVAAAMAHISVVTPVYQAEGCLHELYRRLVDALAGITQDFEIVMVEDCGGDRSWEIIRELAQKDPRVKGIQFSRNFGQHYGITAGLDHCDGDWVVVMDCDLQDRPEDISGLYAKATEGYEIVVARREGARSHHLLKRFGSWLFYKAFRYLAEVEYSQTGNFCMLSRKVVESYRQMRERLRFFGALINWMGFPSATVDVEHDARYDGRSTYTLGKLWRLASDTVIAHSDKPLRLSVQFGFLIAFLAFCYGVYILLQAALYGSAITGWASLIVSFYFLGGIIITILGMLGIYLGKTFDEAKKRPLYIVMRTTFDEQPKPH
jgi:glycosyltransferase involved in cell wall biosynthesis